MKAFIQCAGIALAALLATGNAVAQTYPTRPITMVVPNTPASPYEAAVQYVNAELTKRLGQPIVVEYKPGAGQLIGANYVRNAKPDGYTLLYGSVLGLHPLFVKNNPVDADVLATTPEEQVRMFEAEIRGLAETARVINFQPE